MWNIFSWVISGFAFAAGGLLFTYPGLVAYAAFVKKKRIPEWLVKNSFYPKRYKELLAKEHPKEDWGKLAAMATLSSYVTAAILVGPILLCSFLLVYIKR